MSKILATSEDLTALADAIREKSGDNDSILFPDGFTSKINSLEVWEDEDAYIEGRSTFTSYENSNITSIRPYAFQGMSYLVSVSCINCEEIGSSAFTFCSSLSDLNFPNVIKISSCAFSVCSMLAQITFPKCSYIGAYAFHNCVKLESVYLLGSAFVSLYSPNAFQYTPIQYSSYLSRFGSIFVPASMLASYKEMSGWSTYSNRFVGVGGEE